MDKFQHTVVGMILSLATMVLATWGVTYCQHGPLCFVLFVCDLIGGCGLGWYALQIGAAPKPEH